MDTIKHWLFKRSNHDSNQTIEQNTSASVSTESKQQPTVQPSNLETETLQPLSDKASPFDPKVAEFFKDFPEPFRQRLIQRYSNKDGLYRFDFIRDLAMQREHDYAVRGVILEERREQAELEKEREEEERKKARQEFKQSKKNQEVPEWEKKVQTVIPLQEGETMGFKLFQAANSSALGFLVLWAAIRSRKSQPPLSTFQFVIGMTGAINLCAFFQTAAVYRLMDWGVFDQTSDDRDVLTKVFEEVEKSIKSLGKFHDNNKPDK